MKSIFLLFLLQGLSAIASNRTEKSSKLFIFKDHPRGKRAVLVNNEPNEPCRIYGHRYDTSRTSNFLRTYRVKWDSATEEGFGLQNHTDLTR